MGHKFIILKIRATLRTIRYQCILCQKRDAAIVNPIMADLPKERLGYLEPAFSNCGVDYFSPFFVSIERFIARRGVPNVIWSDNGTNFERRQLFLAEKGLLEVTCCWNDNAPAALVCKGIRWKFNPPSAPHQDGSWERMIRSWKRSVYSILENRRMTDGTLGTTFCLVEQAVNSRPLTPVSDDP